MPFLGLGGAFLGVHGLEMGVATVRRALELGIDYFDTSPMYCQGASQHILGQALDGISQPHRIATKLGYLPARPQFRETGALRAQLTENLQALRRRHVDVLQIHEADLAYWWTDDPEPAARIDATRKYDWHGAAVMQILKAAKQQGICRQIGITGNSAPEMTRLLGALDVNHFLLAFNFDLLTRTAAESALPLAQKKGVAVMLGGILRCGSLAEPHPEWLRSPPTWMTPSLQRRYAQLLVLLEECGLSMQEMAVRFLLGESRVEGFLLGCATPNEVDSAMTAASRGQLPADLHDQLARLSSGT